MIPGYDPYRDADGYSFHEARAQHAVDFFEKRLTHIEGAIAGKPFLLQPWQASIVRTLFGWYDQEGYRRYRNLFLFVARKNGKSPLAAGIANYVLFCDKERGQQNICAAADVEQAAQLYRYIAGMIEQNPTLKGHAKVQKRLIERAGNRLRVIASDAGGTHGGNFHLALIDELHAQSGSAFLEAVDSTFVSLNRREPLLIKITTSDYERESVCNDEYEYAKRVRDGETIDPNYLPVIFEALPTDDWEAQETWAKANPNLGVSVDPKLLREKCERAKTSASLKNSFMRLHLNIRTSTETCFFDAPIWAEQGRITFTVDEWEEEFAALDLSSTRDLTALVRVAPAKSGPRVGYAVYPEFWVPRGTLSKRSRTEKDSYRDWADRGFINATENKTVDFDIIRERLRVILAEGRCRKIAVDPWNAKYFCDLLRNDGWEVIEHGQGMAQMALPTKAVERAYIDRQLWHSNHPVLAWMARNCVVKEDEQENRRPVKRKSSDRIDGIVALIMAVGLAEERLQEVQPWIA